VPIKDAYAQALEATEGEDPILARRKAMIAGKLAASDELLDEVLANEVRKTAEDAIEQARRLASGRCPASARGPTRSSGRCSRTARARARRRTRAVDRSRGARAHN
jgi:hypothetical protein